MPLASGRSPQTYRWALAARDPDPGRRRRARLPGLRVRGRRGRRPGDLRRLHVRRQPVGGPADRRGARRHRRRRRARRGVHLPVARRDPRQQHLVGRTSTATARSGVRWSSLLVLVLLVPIVGEVLKEVGPLVLASRPPFDDMIDGLTFGVAAGAAFAAAETIVVNRGLFSSFGQVDSPERRLLGLADPVGRDGQADRLRRGHRHRRGQLLRSRRRLRRLQAGLLPRPGRGADREHRRSRAACSSPPGSRAPRVPSSASCGVR